MLTMTEKGRILRMWEAGHTSGEIAAALKITRSTVAGVLNRLREAGRIGYRTKTTKPQRPPKAKIVRIKVKAVVEVVAPLPPLPKPVNNASGIEILKLNFRTCRYIVAGEGSPKTTLYCGQEVTRGAYCANHGAMCYTGRDKIMRPKNDFAARSTYAPRYSKGQSNLPFPTRLWR